MTFRILAVGVEAERFHFCHYRMTFFLNPRIFNSIQLDMYLSHERRGKVLQIL